MKRKILFLVLATIAILAVYFYVLPAKPLLSVDKVYDAGDIGSTVLVNVTLSNVPSCVTWGINLTWDPYYIQLTHGAPPFAGGPPYEVREGEFFAGMNSTTFLYFNSLDVVKGQMALIDIFTSSGVYATGSGTILTLNFTIIHPGTSAIELNPPSRNLTQSAIGDRNNLNVEHDEVNGSVTTDGPPPMWASTGFQTNLIYGELGALGLASLIIYVYANPKPPKSAKRSADFQPVIEPEDQA